MPLGELNLKPRRRTDAAVESLRELVDHYCACLWSNGQIAESYLVIASREAVHARVELIGLGALAAEHHTEYANKALGKIRLATRSPVRWKVPPTSPVWGVVSKWQGSSAFFISPVLMDDGNTPVRQSGSRRVVPTYLLPGDRDEIERFVRWARLGQDLWRMWVCSDALEYQAYRQIADVRGSYIRDGRRHAARIEASTGVPTYLEVFRYYNLGKREPKRPCPGCGAQWRQSEAERDHLLFDFRCDRCRLVSDEGCTWELAMLKESPRTAKIGVLPRSKPIVAASVLVERVRREQASE